MTTNRPLRVFLCHSKNDIKIVRELYEKLCAEPWIDPWLDEENLYPGQDWNLEIEKAIEETDVILVCLSNNSITKEGYVQREIRIALDYADYKPEGTLFIIPVRLEECVPPKRLARWQYADYFEGQRERALERLMVSLNRRSSTLGLKIEKDVRKDIPAEEEDFVDNQKKPLEKKVQKFIKWPPFPSITLSNGMEFMRVPAGKFLMGSKDDNKLADDYERPQHVVDIPYDYWMARFPVTNEQYNTYAKSKRIQHPLEDWEKKKDHPVTYVQWMDAMAYCQWLHNLLQDKLPSGLVLRLPTEAEWEKAARGTDGREYPWGNMFDKNRCNTRENGKGDTMPVDFYSPQSDSPYGCADMSGNTWEWTYSLSKPYPYLANGDRGESRLSGIRILRGGSFVLSAWSTRCAYRLGAAIGTSDDYIGFRIAAAPTTPF